MAHSLVESASFDVSVTVPDDGDAAGASSVVTGMQSLANRTKYLNAHSMASASESRENFRSGFPDTVSFPGFAYNGIGAWQNSTTGAVLNFHLDLPHGQVLNTVTIYFKGGPGHVAQPTMPTLKIYKRLMSGTTATQLGSTATDTWTNAGAFETSHSLAVGSLAHTIDRTSYFYMAFFAADSGGNAQTGLIVHGLDTLITRTSFGSD